jgi:hypothetical protein
MALSSHYVGFVPAKAPSDLRPMANGQQHPHRHGCRRRKWPPSATLKAKKNAMMRLIDGGRCPEQANMLFSGNEPVSSPQNAPMARRDSSPSLLHHRSVLRALDQLIAGEKQIRLLGALSPINPMHMRLKLDFICGGRGPFPGATAMVVLLVVSLWQAWKAYWLLRT